MAVGDFDDSGASASGGVSTFNYRPNFALTSQDRLPIENDLQRQKYLRGRYETDTPLPLTHTLQSDSFHEQRHLLTDFTGGIARGDVDGGRLFREPDILDLPIHYSSNDSNRLSLSSSHNHTSSNATARATPTIATPTREAEQRAANASAGLDRDGFMLTAAAKCVVDMGFPSELIRTVIHLKVVESGTDYRNADDLLDAVLAYQTVMIDTEDWPADSSATPPQLHADHALHHTPRNNPATPTVGGPSGQTTPPAGRPSEQTTPAVGRDVTDFGSVGHAGRLTSKPKPVKMQVKRKGGQSGSSVLASSNHDQTDGAKSETVVPPWLIKEENQRLKMAKLCKVCQEREVKVVFLPCGHLVCCDMCSSLLSKCSLCQKDIKGSVKIFMA